MGVEVVKQTEVEAEVEVGAEARLEVKEKRVELDVV